MFGDPHITTFDGVNYTFSGLGDFVLVQAQDGNSSFLMQGRTAQTGSAQASNFVAFAAQYHSSSLVDPFTVREVGLQPSLLPGGEREGRLEGAGRRGMQPARVTQSQKG